MLRLKQTFSVMKCQKKTTNITLESESELEPDIELELKSD